MGVGFVVSEQVTSGDGRIAKKKRKFYEVMYSIISSAHVLYQKDGQCQSFKKVNGIKWVTRAD